LPIPMQVNASLFVDNIQKNLITMIYT